MESNIYTDNIIEGEASICTPPGVFYNAVQEFNRDMSVAALRVFVSDYYVSKKTVKLKDKSIVDKSSDSYQSSDTKSTNDVTVLEPLSATGLRSIRYAREVSGIKQIYANDRSYKAVECIKYNIEKNGVEHLVTATNADAVWLMQKFNFENKHMDVIDLDPYGCPTRFLDAAVNCIEDGGLLMVTCTDMAVTAGNTPETCFVKYGAISLRSSACHEMALRIALHCVSSSCGRYGKYIVPLLSFSADFYIRLFLMVKYGQQNCKKVSSNTSMVYQCNGCGMMTLQPLGNTVQSENNCKFSLPVGPPVSTLCAHCNHRHKLGGPIWSEKIHNEDFIDKMLSLLKSVHFAHNDERMFGMLSVIKEELHDVPLFYTINYLCGKLHCEMIPLRSFRCALLNGGYRVSISHCTPNSLKTDAPNSVVLDIMRCWIRDHPVREKRLKICDVVREILKQTPMFVADFSACNGDVPLSSRNHLLRFQMNPTPNWGPGVRARSHADSNEMECNKKKRNQNKHAAKKAKLFEPFDDRLMSSGNNTDQNVSSADLA